MDSPHIPPWPSRDPGHGSIRLRRFADKDASMAMDLSQDPYVPTIGSLPALCTEDEALQFVERQRQRHCDGTGFSFVIADTVTDRALGAIGLWLRELGSGRAQAGYSVVPRERGKNVAATALTALTDFAWTIPELHRIELHIEPWNTASIRVAEHAGYQKEGLLRSHQEIAGERRDMLIFAAIRSQGIRKVRHTQ